MEIRNVEWMFAWSHCVADFVRPGTGLAPCRNRAPTGSRVKINYKNVHLLLLSPTIVWMGQNSGSKNGWSRLFTHRSRR